MADWVDYRIETFSKELADTLLPKLRVLDHQLLTRKIEELMREAFAEGRRSELAPLAERIAKGRAKYANGCTVLSLLDEAGEVAHAVNKYERADRIREELLDVAAVAMRLYFGEIDRGLEIDGLVQRRTGTPTPPSSTDGEKQ